MSYVDRQTDRQTKTQTDSTENNTTIVVCIITDAFITYKSGTFYPVRPTDAALSETPGIKQSIIYFINMLRGATFTGPFLTCGVPPYLTNPLYTAWRKWYPELSQ